MAIEKINVNGPEYISEKWEKKAEQTKRE